MSAEQPTNMQQTRTDGMTTPIPSEQPSTRRNVPSTIQTAYTRNTVNVPNASIARERHTNPGISTRSKSRPGQRNGHSGQGERTMYYMGRTQKNSFTRIVKSHPGRDAGDTEPIPTLPISRRNTVTLVVQTDSKEQPLSVISLTRHPSRVLLSRDLSPVTTTPSLSTTKLLQRQQRKRKLYLRHLSRKYIQQARMEKRRAFYRLWLSIASISLVLLIIFLSMTGVAAYTGFHLYQSAQQYTPQVLTLRQLVPLDNLKMYDSKGILIGQLTDQGLHTSVNFEQVTPAVVNATVAIEDKNFWTNPGIDIQGILRAALDDAKSGHVVEGGSTITQQLIKNLVVGDAVTIQRKLEELILSPQLNSAYSKADIMDMYLNTIYYGQQAYGIDAAAMIYFGLSDQPNKPASMQLDLAQAAMLAGIPNSPDAFNPLLHPQAALNRFQSVLAAMQEQHYITTVQELDAIKEEQQPNFFRTAHITNRAPQFFNFLLGELENDFHLTRAQLSRSDMKVYTTLDITLQDKIQKIMQQHIAALRYTHNVSNAAEVLIDFHTGAIISLLGSINYNDASIDGQFDVATQGYRQPGSSFKPYVYVTAFEQGASPAQAIDDAPLTIYLPDSTFTPQNYDLRFHGQMTLRCALQNSLNVPAVKVLEHVGINNAMQTAYNMGVTSYEGTPGYSLVLGGLGVRLIDHTSAYGTFADGGVHVPYYGVQKVVFAQTQQTYVHRVNTGQRVISPQLAYMMTNVLSDNPDRLPEFYDCNVLQLYSNTQQQCWAGKRGTVRPAAAKTGTTNDFRDNWTMGYTTDYVMGVWAGNDNNTPMWNITGVDGAAPIWHDAMLAAEQGHSIRNFTNPSGLVWAKATYTDGVQTSDWFLPGTVPTSTQMLPTPTPSGTVTPTATVTPISTNSPNTLQGARGYCPSYTLVSPSLAATSNAGWW